MLAMAAAQLGFKCHIYSDTSGPAFDVAAMSTVADYNDLDAIKAFAASVDVITYEFENVPLDAAAAVETINPVRPAPKALEVAQDRLVEKTFISNLGLTVAPFASVLNAEDLAKAVAQVGTPAILKTARLGYDGKGQVRLSSANDAKTAHAEIDHQPAVLEDFVDFKFEVSVLLARDLDGRCKYYDLPLNTHRNGILDTSTVPSPLSADDVNVATDMAKTIADALGYVGLLAVELFYLGPEADTSFVVNEIAPRVHNSGHWTLDACTVCQFQNHIRAIAGWPLGPTDRHSDAVMTNLIGADVEAWNDLSADNVPHGLHLYGKNEARPGRKMAHITRLTPKTGA